MNFRTLTSAAVFLCSFTAQSQETSLLPEGVFFEPGPINAASIVKGEETLQFYRSSSAKATMAVLVNQRRDLVEAGRPGIGPDTQVLAPAESVELLADPQTVHWQPWWEKRFDYYGQQVTKIPLHPLKAGRGLADGDEFEFQGLKLRAVKTTGYTREGTSILTEIGGKKIAFTGDLLREGGRVSDIYSFQDTIPAAKIGSYHGHGARFGQWIESLQKIAAEKPDLIVPARGPLITDPAGDIARAIDRVRAVYQNYLSTNALHWYFGEERLKIAGGRVLESVSDVELMPFAEHIDLPDWCQHIGTTKLLISEDKSGFVLDVGGTRALETLQQAVKDGLVKKIEGIWVTHTHNDHTRAVREAAEAFDCPVYAVAEVADVMENPGNWFLPGITNNPVPVVTRKDGDTMEWKEFTFTSHFFPGQMYNHGGLLVEKPDHKPVFFIGDSFSPSGIDDYCLMNRNLMREDTGFQLCFKKVRALPEGSWLVNQHIPHLFRFNEKEMNYLETRYQARHDTLAELLPWDDVNYGIDEEWAWFYPYGQEAKAGDEFELELRLWNHSRKERTFSVAMDPAEGIEWESEGKGEVKIGARENGTIAIRGKLNAGAAEKVHVVTAGIRSGDDIDLSQWIEALIKVGE